MDELDSRHFFSNCQYGFRPGRGTGNALVASTCVWHQHFDVGADVCCAFFDFKKAFDSIPHESLLNKLSLLQIHPALFRWLRDYLSSRCQRVVIENSSSEFLPVTSGVNFGPTSISDIYKRSTIITLFSKLVICAVC